MDYVLGPQRNAAITSTNGLAVRLSEDSRQCVVFLGHASGDDFDAGGTGFIVITDDGLGKYLVTARHVAKQLEGGPFDIRFNSIERGESVIAHVDDCQWHEHPDEKVDIALTPFFPPGGSIGYMFPTKHCLDNRDIQAKDIGAGDLVCVVGLFRLLHGNRRNLPVVHTGHIALFPEDELIPVRDESHPDGIRYCEGYLVEAQGLPGLSGSPVFVRRSFRTTATLDGGKTANKIWLHGSLSLLGVWIAAWDAPPGEVLSAGRPQNIRVPVGMGIVAPAYRLREILEMPEIAQPRESEQARRDFQRAASADSLLSTTADNPQHAEDFSRLLSSVTTGKLRED